MRIPEDVSVISIDDIIVSRFMTPSLTTVRIDQEMIIRKGLDLLVRQINAAGPETVTISGFELMERQSVRTL